MKEPEWAALPTETPAPIRKLLRRCLDKDRARRLESAADARLEIEDVLAGSADAMTRRPRLHRGPDGVASLELRSR